MSKRGICKICGKEFVKVGQEQICGDECRKKAYREAEQRCYRNRNAKKELKDREKKSNLNEKVEEANKRGISYGELMAEKYIDSIRKRKTL